MIGICANYSYGLKRKKRRMSLQLVEILSNLEGVRVILEAVELLEQEQAVHSQIYRRCWHTLRNAILSVKLLFWSEISEQVDELQRRFVQLTKPVMVQPFVYLDLTRPCLQLDDIVLHLDFGNGNDI